MLSVPLARPVLVRTLAEPVAHSEFSKTPLDGPNGFPTHPVIG